MKSVLVALGLLAGCDKVFSLDTVPRDAPAADVAIDSPRTDAGQTCIGGLYFLVCYDADEVGAAISVLPSGSRTIDTTDDAACTQTRNVVGEVPLCIAIVSAIDVEAMATLRVTGPRPLVLAADGDVRISGIVDVGSHGGSGLAGAGADPATCPAPVAGETQQAGTNHAGGGAGGSYIGTGGNGGSGETTTAVAQPAMTAPFIAGGCPGGAGGSGITVTGGSGGHGGGAIYLIAKGAMTISGKVSASGQGGTSHSSTSSPADFPGGGGGGAGGMIVLEADTMIVATSAALIASGGGGGGGGNGSANGTGGGDGTFAGGPGGAGGMASGTSFGGFGGSGSTSADSSGKDGLPGGSQQGGGGGGGGGAGIIRLHAVTLMNKSTQISPPPMP